MCFWVLASNSFISIIIIIIIITAMATVAYRSWGILVSAQGRDSSQRLRLVSIWEFPTIRGTLFGVLVIRILVFWVLKRVPHFRKLPFAFLSEELNCLWGD